MGTENLNMKNLKDSMINFIVNAPIKVLILGALIVLAFVPGILKMQADFSYKGYYKADHPLIVAFSEFEKTFGGDDRIAIVIHSPSGIFDKDSIDLVWKITQEMWEASNIIRVDSLTNHNWVTTVDDDLTITPFIDPDEDTLSDQFLKQKKLEALKDEVLPNYMISQNATTTMIIGRFNPIFDGKGGYQKGITELRKIIAKYENTSDHQFYLAGNAMVNQVFKEISQSDMKFILPILFGMISILLLYIFKSASGIIYPLIVIGLSNMMSFGLAGYLGVKYSNIIAALPIILIAISIADTIHILLSYRHGMSDGLSSVEAAKQSFSKNLLPTFLTSFSTAIGFISLSGSQLLPIAGLGMLGASGSIFAWLLTYLFVAPLIIIFSRKQRAAPKMNEIKVSSSLISRYVNWLNKWRYQVIIGFFIASVASVYIGLQNEINSDPLVYLSKKVPFRIATDFMDHNIGGASGIEISIDSGSPDGIKNPDFVNKVNQLSDWLKSRKFYTKVVSYIDIVKEMNQNLNAGDPSFYKIPETKEEIAQGLFLYGLSVPQGKDINDQVTIDNSSVRVSGLWTMHSSSKILKEINQINSKIKEIGLKGVVTGKMPVYHNMNGFVVQTFFTSILSALALIGLIMILLFRSIKIGLISMIPNIIPLFFGSALMALLSKPLDIGTVIIGAICLGIAIDDTIHFLVTYLKYRENNEKIDSLVLVLKSTGVALIGTTAILILGFGTFVLGQFVPNSNLGMGTALILFVALVVDLVLLPSIILINKKM